MHVVISKFYIHTHIQPKHIFRRTSTGQDSIQYLSIQSCIIRTIIPSFQWVSNGYDLWPLGRLKWNFRYIIFWLILVTDGWGVSCEIAIRWISMNLTGVKSALPQATSHYLSQCWPSSMTPYGIDRPQWVYSLAPETHEILQVYFLNPFQKFENWTTSWDWSRLSVIGQLWWEVSISSANGLVPSGNKTLPEPIVTQSFVAIWHH